MYRIRDWDDTDMRNRKKRTQELVSELRMHGYRGIHLGSASVARVAGTVRFALTYPTACGVKYVDIEAWALATVASKMPCVEALLEEGHMLCTR